MSRQEKEGIWRYKDRLPQISSQFRLTLDEGNTSLKKVADIFFKCEFENPTGSVKDRGIAYQMAKVKQSGVKTAVLSSSGNAAISAASYCRLHQINLHVFISVNINKNKLAVLKQLKCQIYQSKKPISSAFKFAKANKAFNLRQSTDPNATAGFETIAYELNEKEPKTDAIFIPVSSGTTLVGIADGYKKLGRLPAFHIIQTEAVHPIASLYDHAFCERKKCLADAIVAKFTPRSEKIQEIINKSQGFGWVISDGEMEVARNWLLSHKLNCSYEGAAALASLWKAAKAGYSYNNPVCLLTGKFYSG